MRRLVASFVAIIVLCFGIALASASGDSPRPAPAEHHAPTTQPAVDRGAQLLKAQAVVEYGQAIERQAVGSYISSVEIGEIVAYTQSIARANLAVYLASIPRPAPAPARPQYRASAPAPSAPSSGGGACAAGGGSLNGAPAYVVQRESGGNYCAKNPTSSACGAYQILDSTWAGFGGYSSACDAPPAVQDAKAQTMAPCNWNPPNYCAG